MISRAKPQAGFNPAVGSCDHLPSQIQTLQNAAVPIHVCPFEIIEKSTTLTNQLQQSPPRVMVLFVGFEVFREIADALAEERYLHFWRASIGLVCLEILDNFPFLLSS